ncbi:hypothetical protein P3W24_06505 [Luteibacter sp. PPL201]|uniref:DUF2188 domain-containing protein n=1 Tax=Luteibacter sahnii TaxID=3021977 RepID=A0ABT6B908_9GAMM|nr:hypothetical protein [Luteibacter sp. PPL193]MDY1549524.1 hypothetical protein [Luteibacter sp. PPL193]
MSQTTLYLPYTDSPRGLWNVLRNSEMVGRFDTPDEAMRHARNLVRSLRAQSGQSAEIKVEDERGTWRLADAGD